MVRSGNKVMIRKYAYSTSFWDLMMTRMNHKLHIVTAEEIGNTIGNRPSP